MHEQYPHHDYYITHYYPTLSEIIDLDSMENTVNKNGPDSVPFRVNFNSLALNDSGRETE